MIFRRSLSEPEGSDCDPSFDSGGMEKEVKQAVRRENFPIIKSSCPVDGHTEREWAKQWVREMEHQKRDIKSQIFGAMRRAHISDW